MNGYRITFGLGLGFDRDGVPIPPDAADAYRSLAINLVTKWYGGCFAIDGSGAWNDGSRIVAEKGVNIVVDHQTDRPIDAILRDAKAVANNLGYYANQEAVTVSVIPCLCSCHNVKY